MSSPPSPPVFIHPWMALTLFPQLCKKPFGVIYLLWPRNSFQSHCLPRQTAPFSRFHLYFSVCYLTFGETEWDTLWLKGTHLPSKVAPAVIFFFGAISPHLFCEIIRSDFFYSLPCSCCECSQSLLLSSSFKLRQSSRERLAPRAESELCFSHRWRMVEEKRCREVSGFAYSCAQNWGMEFLFLCLIICTSCLTTYNLSRTFAFFSVCFPFSSDMKKRTKRERK